MIETPARAKNVSQPDRNIQFWQKFFSREYTQCSNLPCLISSGLLVLCLQSSRSPRMDIDFPSETILASFLLDEPLGVWNVHQFSEY